MKNNEILARREQILDIIRSTGTLQTEDAAEIFHVSKETIRQDFIYLEKQGILKKKYGGAVLNTADAVASVRTRESVNFMAKDKIVKKALEFIPEGPVSIGLDQGSTIALLGSYISHRNDLFIATNNLRALQSLVGTNNKVYAIGGFFNQEEMSYISDEYPKELEKVRLDIIFLGSSGLKGRNGICSKGFQDSRTKRNFLKHAEKKIVLTDSTKFSHTSLVETASWDELDVLITDRGIPDDIRKELETHLQVVVV